MKQYLAAIALSVCGLLASAVQPKLSVSILGDSYSTYEGHVKPSTNEVWYYCKNDVQKTDVTDVRQTWWHQLIRHNGWKLDTNNSYSGSTISYTGYDGNDYSARSFLTRMDNLGAPDIIFVFGATNDSWAGTPIGDYDFEHPEAGDFRKFRPALIRLLDRMTALYPGTEIYFLLNDCLTPEVNESVRSVCRHYGVTCIELHDIDKISGHPSVSGHASIASQIEASLGLGR